MDRYNIGGEGVDAFQPDSDGVVLKNYLGVTDPDEMGQIEAQALYDAIIWSDNEFGLDTEFSFETVQLMHRVWLGKIYPFAGTVRTVNISKGGFTFAPIAYLENSLREFDGVLIANTPCEGLSRHELVKAISLVHAELLLVHPFREGNGRLARWLADLMAMQGEMPPLDWGFSADTVRARDDYFAALNSAYAKETDALETLVDEALKRSLTS